jgi:hypothetical protein
VRPATVVLATLILAGLASPTAAQQDAAATRERIAQALSELRRDVPEISLPDAATVVQGGRVIAAGEQVAGPIAAWDGDIEVRGVVTGDVLAIDGDVIIADGGRVDGDVLSVRGQTRVSGVVTGTVMRLEGSLAPPSPVAAPTPASSVWRSLGVALATFAIFLMLGIGVLVFAGPTLDGVAEAMERGLARSFVVGIGGQLALIPGLLLVVAALTLTLIGVLLVPFAIVAYVFAVAGAATLALLAVAMVIGRAVSRRRRSATLARRAEALRAMLIGISVLFVAWIAGAALEWAPLLAAIVRIVALVITWVAVTAGFGAVLISRAGTRRAEPLTRATPVEDDMAWQTPTPVSGVAAARRPTPVTSGSSR